MPKMISPAGEMEIGISDIDVEHNDLLITGKFGVWDSKIYITPEDTRQFVKMMLKWRVISYILKLPFLWLKPSPQKETGR